MANTIKCLVNGRELSLSPEAFAMAKEYFGAEKISDLIAAKPIELSKPLLIPKPLTKEIIPPVEKVVDKLPETKVEPAVEKLIEVPKVERKPAVRKKVVKKAAK